MLILVFWVAYWIIWIKNLMSGFTYQWQICLCALSVSISRFGYSQQIVLFSDVKSLISNGLSYLQHVRLFASSIWLSSVASSKQTGLSARSIWLSEVSYFWQMGLVALNIWLSAVAFLQQSWLFVLSIWLSGVAHILQIRLYVPSIWFLRVSYFPKRFEYLHQVVSFFCIILIRDLSSYCEYNFVHTSLKIVVEIFYNKIFFHMLQNNIQKLMTVLCSQTSIQLFIRLVFIICFIDWIMDIPKYWEYIFLYILLKIPGWIFDVRAGKYDCFKILIKNFAFGSLLC